MSRIMHLATFINVMFEAKRLKYGLGVQSRKTKFEVAESLATLSFGRQSRTS